MELLRDGSPGSSAEVRVSNALDKRTQSVSPLPPPPRHCAVTRKILIRKCYDTLFKQAQRYSLNICRGVSLGVTSTWCVRQSEHPRFALETSRWRNLHLADCRPNRLISAHSSLTQNKLAHQM